MQLVTKKVKGHKYWYAVQKGRRGKTVTNVKTIYLGKTETLLRRLGLGENAEECDDTLLPAGFSTLEAGASTALWELANELGLPAIVDDVCGERRVDAAIPFGTLVTVLAIQRAIAPPGRKSLRRTAEWLATTRLEALIKADAAGFDFRRVHEALEQIDSGKVERIEDGIVVRIIEKEKLSMDGLAFDATNFDSYACSTTGSRLLKRGNAKSKKKNLRVLGMGLLVTSDDGIPLLSFSYPGNKADVTSFKSFLLRLRRRLVARKFGPGTTVVCDGGNISKEVVTRLEKGKFRYVARLPRGHAPEADALRTSKLPIIMRHQDGSVVAAKKIHTEVYGKQRSVVAIFSESMKKSQLPGLKRDIKKAEEDLGKLAERLERQSKGRVQSRYLLTTAQTEKRAANCLTRQHMKSLYSFKVGGSDSAPTLTWKFEEGVWQNLKNNHLGRTTAVTDQTEWTELQVVKALAEQSHAEDAFRQLKDRRWVSAMPLECRNDRQLRVRSLVAVYALILSTVLRRRLRKRGIDLSMDEMLAELSVLQYGFLQYSLTAPSGLQTAARSKAIPPSPTQLQRRIVRALRVGIELGPTRKRRRVA